MASVLQTIKAITSEGYLSNYLRDWLNGIERSIPKGSDTQTVRFNGDVLEATNALVIDATGNVGIGTGSPRTFLNINTTASPNNITGRATMSVGPRGEDGLSASIYLTQASSDVGMSIANDAVDPNGIVFGSWNPNYAERMRIDSNGYALIGYTSSNGAFRLQVNSQIFATNSTIATSDARFKANVLDIPTGMDVVSALRPVSFDWKQGEGHNFVEHRDLGFIAQEAETALSGKEYIKGVVKDVGSFKGMAYDKLIPILVKALQEQKAEIDSLTTRIEALEV